MGYAHNGIAVAQFNRYTWGCTTSEHFQGPFISEQVFQLSGPYGLATPFTIRNKIILHQTWRSGKQLGSAHH